MLRAAFWLLAVIIGVELLVTVGSMGTCMWLLLMGNEKIGACEGLGNQVRELWSEALAAILALLLAARETKPNPPTTDKQEC
jgi:hypothetical protein